MQDNFEMVSGVLKKKTGEWKDCIKSMVLDYMCSLKCI